MTSDETLDPRIERTRAAALDAAVGLLKAEGTNGVTHGTVAANARVSRTTVYRHWPTREDLLRATLETMVGPEHKETTGRLRHDLLQSLGELADHLRDPERVKMICSVIERSWWDPVVADVKCQMSSKGSGDMGAILQRGIDDGELRPDLDIELATDQLAGTVFVRRLIRNRPIDRKVVTRLVDEFITSNTPV